MAATDLLIKPRWCSSCGRRVIHSVFSCPEAPKPRAIQMQFEFWLWRNVETSEWGFQGISWPVGGVQ